MNLIVANWKCNPKTRAEAEKLFSLVLEGIKSIQEVEVVICPPFVYLSNASRFTPCASRLKLGAQDCFWEESGAFTGEVSVPMLKDIGCEYVIVGHSERRKYFGETDEIINKKLKAILKIGLKPILCIGETKEQRESGSTENVLQDQLEKAVSGLSINEIKNLSIAYEPIWAIGTGNPCEAKEAEKISLFIQETISKIYGREATGVVKVLYGGSVNSENSSRYLAQKSINGLLIGGASLKPEEFVKIIKTAKN